MYEYKPKNALKEKEHRLIHHSGIIYWGDKTVATALDGFFAGLKI